MRGCRGRGWESCMCHLRNAPLDYVLHICAPEQSKTTKPCNYAVGTTQLQGMCPCPDSLLLLLSVPTPVWGRVKCCSSTCYIFSCCYTSSFWPLIAAKIQLIFETTKQRAIFFRYVYILRCPHHPFCSYYRPHNQALKP